LIKSGSQNRTWWPRPNTKLVCFTLNKTGEVWQQHVPRVAITVVPT